MTACALYNMNESSNAYAAGAGRGSARDAGGVRPRAPWRTSGSRSGCRCTAGTSRVPGRAGTGPDAAAGEVSFGVQHDRPRPEQRCLPPGLRCSEPSGRPQPRPRTCSRRYRCLTSALVRVEQAHSAAADDRGPTPPCHATTNDPRGGVKAAGSGIVHLRTLPRSAGHVVRAHREVLVQDRRRPRDRPTSWGRSRARAVASIRRHAHRVAQNATARGRRDVQRVDAPGHRDAHHEVRGRHRRGREAVALGAEHQRQPLGRRRRPARPASSASSARAQGRDREAQPAQHLDPARPRVDPGPRHLEHRAHATPGPLGGTAGRRTAA